MMVLDDSLVPALVKTRNPQKDSLVDVAHRELQKRFVTLELAPGSIWKEVDLADLVGIGRTPVREAVQRMASDQLVTVIQRAGILISTPTLQDQLSILETRRVLETLVSIGAAKRARDDERRYLESVADSIESAGHRGDVLAYLQWHLETKQHIAQFARNSYAARALAPLHTFSQRFYFIYYRHFNNLEKVGQAHASLSRAIASGNLEATERSSQDVADIAEAFTRDLLDLMV